MRITWYGHSAFRLDFKDKAALIDPFFTDNPGVGGDTAAAEKGLTHILVTHGHFDHLGDTVAISQRTGAKVVTNFDLCMWIAAQGVKNFDPMNTGGTTDQGGFSVTLVRADHSASVMKDGVSQSLGSPNGVIVTAPGEPTVYHMGDTDIFSDMALINELYAPDVAMVPMGDRFTMGPKKAALAVKRFFKLKAVFPCHYGSFVPMVEKDASNFLEEMKGHATQVIVPEKGKAVEV
jgi:L-ascorbate metabolism protein UlaG (beta-lactamase superfamily)